MAKTTLSGHSKLIMRITALKESVSGRIDYTTLYEYEYGKQTAETLNKIRMVWALRTVDADITAKLEKIIKKYNRKAVA